MDGANGGGGGLGTVQNGRDRERPDGRRNDSRGETTIRSRRGRTGRATTRADVQRDLVERARKGDHDAFAALAGTTIARLYAAARLIIRDPTRAEDAVQ